MLIRTENLSLTYKDGKNIVQAVNKINIQFPARGYFGIIGPSGSGKTSLLYLLSGIRNSTSGQVIFNDQPLPKSNTERNQLRRQHMGFVFQFHFLLNYLTVEQNILVGSREVTTKSMRRVNELMETLDILNVKKRFPYELSGGQRQRIAIGRALANNPEIIFVDEPTASLDHTTGKKVVTLLKNFAKKACVIVVTHDESILKDADNTFKMWDGRIVE